MSSKNISLNLSSVTLKKQLVRIRRYSTIIYIVFITGLFGLVFFRISTLSNAEPTDDQVNSQVQAARVPHIDEDTINQLRSLQDNSVSVQTLFNNARSNPF